MEFRKLSRTSLTVSILGFGASPFGDVYRRTSTTDYVEAVNAAIDNGINFFDVSPYYGVTLAESRLGEVLRGHRTEVVLATKCGRYGADEFDFSADRITLGLEESLTRLHTDHVDLLQAHDVEFGRVDQIVNETLPAMRELQKQGKARYVGITGYSLANLVEIAERAELDTILTYCRHNLLIGDMERTLLPAAEKYGIGLINASPLHMGVLTEQGAPDWHPAPLEVHEVGRRITALCHRHNLNVSEIALNFALQNSGVASTLVGLSSKDEVLASLRALELKPDPELLAEIASIARSVYGHIWPSGLLENYG